MCNPGLPIQQKPDLERMETFVNDSVDSKLIGVLSTRVNNERVDRWLELRF